MTNNASHQIGQNGANSKSIFGTDGIRGHARTLLKPNLVMQIGYCCGISLKAEGPVIIGHDSRESCSMIIAALTAGLTSAGREVWNLGLCPTPTVPFVIKEFDAAGGLMVSASHNQPEDNGIKIFSSNGKKLNLEEQQNIEESLSNQSVQPQIFGKAYTRTDLLEVYKQSLINSIGNQNLKDIPIVLDLCWGSATNIGEEIFKSLGANVIVINGRPDGKKINVNCGSTNLRPLKKAVLENEAQMGFAFDGDADRVIAIDERGRVVNGDHILYLWGSYLKNKKELFEDRLVATVMSNLGFEKAWESQGGILERTLIGDQHVHEKIIATHAKLGGEQSGHILSSINGYCGDGLLSALQLSYISKSLSLRLSEWLNQSFTPYPQKLINVPINKKTIRSSWSSSKSIKEEVQKAELALGDQGRVLIRESGTEAILRVMVESKDEDLVNTLSLHLAKIADNNLNAA